MQENREHVWICTIRFFKQIKEAVKNNNNKLTEKKRNKVEMAELHKYHIN